MLQNTRVTAFTISGLLRENQLGWLIYSRLALNSGFTFAILQALGKLPNVVERLRKSLTGFVKM